MTKSELLSRIRGLILGSHTRSELLLNLCEKAPDEGIFVEFGIDRGSSLALLVYVGMQQNRVVHGYDSFVGLPKPTYQDYFTEPGPVFCYPTKTPWTKHCLAPCSGYCGFQPEDVRKHLNEIGVDGSYPILHAGQFSVETVVHFDSCALAHIDLDYYDGTYWACKKTWPLLAQNGTMVIHDYRQGWPGATRAVDTFLAETTQGSYLLECNCESAIITKS